MAASSMAAAGFKLTCAAASALLTAACASIAADGRTFENSRWRVAAINGQATPASGEYRIAFADGAITGRFGCNQFGGRYAVTGDMIVVREVASTLMGCAEPAATFESVGLRVLGSPLLWTWVAGTQVTLSNSAGSLQLARVP